jgi:hypothetical protein
LSPYWRTCADEFVHLVHLLPTKNISQIVAPPQCNSQISLPCSPLYSNSHTNCKVGRLVLPTSHMTSYSTPPPLFLFSSKCGNFLKIPRTKLILPVVLYGCETWSLTLIEEHRLRVFLVRVLRRIFGPKRDEMTVGWRKLHNEEFHNLYN